MTETTIRILEQDDFDQWLMLWADYLGQKPDPEAMRAVFDFLIDLKTPSEAFVACDQTTLTGFAHIIYHPSTYMQACQVSFMEDLMVHPEYRGRRIGKQLIDYSLKRAKEKQCARFYWITGADNINAQRLYDHYAPGIHWQRYAIEL